MQFLSQFWTGAAYVQMLELSRGDPPGAREVELSSDARVTDLLDALGVPPESQLTLGVNGELAQLDSALHDGDKVMLVTPMEGGSAHA